MLAKLALIASTLLIFFILLFGYSKLAGPINFSINNVTTNKQDFFSVTGEGKVTGKPDLAIVRAGVNSFGSTAKQARDQLNSKMNLVTEAVKKAGVDPKDIQTENYNISPNYDYGTPVPLGATGTGSSMMEQPIENTKQNPKITGYNANSELVIKIRNIDNANAVVDAATDAGANNVGGITFDIADKTKLENDARTLAVKEAKSKAEQATKIAGFSLGKVINYQEDFGGGYPRPYAMAKEDSGEGDTQIEPGQNEINISVTLSYEVK